MIKASDIVLTGLMIAAAVWTFQIKHEAELSSDKVAGLLRLIDREQDKIDLRERLGRIVGPRRTGDNGSLKRRYYRGQNGKF